MEKKRCYGCMRMKTKSPICEYCGYDETRQNAIHQLPVGTVLREQYMVGRVLGQGGFGITYLGWDLYLDIPVAIKEYYPSGMVMRETGHSNDVSSCTGDAGERFRNNKERFLREAKMLARFSQVPEIVQVKNFFLANNTAYIVMEYLEGITLKEYVAQQGGRLSIEETLRILEPMIRALQRVHKAGIVHRDISPDNIMMLPDGRAKLLDFGAVRDVGTVQAGQSLTKSTEAILKQGYAPIEQYQKRGSLGPWTDVYAMCATIYFCITGHVPADAPERLLADMDLDLNIPGLTELQKQALDHGMALRVEERTGSMEKLYEELTRQPEPVPDPDPDPVPDPEPDPIPNPDPIPEPLPDPVPITEESDSVTVAAEDSDFLTAAAEDTDSVTAVVSDTDSVTAAVEDADSVTAAVSDTDSVTVAGEDSDFLTAAAEDTDSVTAVVSDTDSVTVAGEDSDFITSGAEDSDQMTAADREPVIIEDPDPIPDPDPDPDPVPVPRPGTGKKWIIAAAAAALLLAVCVALVLPRSGKEGEKPELPDLVAAKDESGSYGNIQWHLDAKTGHMTLTGSGPVEDFSPPQWDDGHPTAPWNYIKPRIRSLEVGEGITELGGNSFSGCSSLKTVTLPGSVTRLGWNCFENSGLQQINLPEGLRVIDGDVFSDTRLSEVEVPASVQELGSAFQNIPTLKSLTLLGDPRINADTWDGSLVNSYGEPIPEGFVLKGESSSAAEAYARVTGLPFEAIRTGTWENQGTCGTDLRWYLDGETHTLFIDGSGEMENFTSWKNTPWNRYREEIWTILLGDEVTGIGTHAFEGCRATDVHFGKNLKTIGAFAFAESGVDEAILPKQVQQVGPSAFSGCPWLHHIHFGPRTELQNEGNFSVLTSKKYPYAAFSLVVHGEPDSAAQKLAEAEHVSFQSGESWCVPWMKGYSKEVRAQPRTLTGACGQGLTWELNQKTGELTIRGQGKMPDYDGPWDVEGQNVAPWYMLHNEIRKITVEDGVTSVGNAAFAQCMEAEEVELGKTVKTIGHDSFNSLKATEILLPDGLTEIRGWAFTNARLEHITIPSTVKKLNCLFTDCRQLQSITMSPETQVFFEIWSDGLLNPAPWNRNPEHLVIRGAEGSHAQVYAAMLGADFEATMEGSWDQSGTCGEGCSWYLDLDTGTMLVDGSGSIPDYASWQDTPWSQYLGKIKLLAIGNGITRIGTHAFERGVLESVYFGKGLQSVGSYAFAGNGKLHNPMLPDSLSTLEPSAFAGCRELGNIYIPGGCRIVEEEYHPFTSLQNPRMSPVKIETTEGSPAEAFAAAKGLGCTTHNGMFKNWQ